MELSGLDGIRWVVEDALKFAQREQRRGKKYRGIVLDPQLGDWDPKAKNGVSKINFSTCVKPLPPWLSPAVSSS